MPDRPETEALLELFERMDQRALEHLHRVESPSMRESMLHRSSLVPGLVEPIDPAEFQIPAWLPKAAGAEEAAALVKLFEAVRFANDEHVGEPLRELHVLLNADPALLALRDAFLAWGERYVRIRLAKPSPRDRGDPFARFHRLHDEIVPWLSKVAARRQEFRLVGHVMQDLCPLIARLLYCATWRPLVRLHRLGGRFAPDLSALDPRWQKVAWILIEKHRWDLDPYAEEAVEALSGAPEVPNAAERRREWAEDLVEMRPLLIRGFDPRETVVAVRPDLWVGFVWALAGSVGTLSLGRTEASVLQDLDTGLSHWLLAVEPDGSVRQARQIWSRMEALPGGDAAATELLDAVHRRLFALYDRVDLAAAMEPAAEPEGQDAVVAAACEVLRRRDPTPRLGVRTTQLLAVLQRLGCEVRPGKGSEISIYRPGARIWTLAHHKRNERVGWAHIRQILKRLDIAPEAWAAAI